MIDVLHNVFGWIGVVFGAFSLHYGWHQEYHAAWTAALLWVLFTTLAFMVRR